MKIRRISWRSALAILCAGLSVTLLGQMILPIGNPLSETLSTRTDPPVAEDSPSFGPAVQAGADTLTALAEHPLFLPARKFDVTASRANSAASAPAGPQELPNLIGIVYTPMTRIALFRIANAPEIARIPQGGTIGRWKLTNIAPNQVTLSAADGVQKLQLFGTGQTLSAMLQGATNSYPAPTSGMGTAPGIPPMYSPPPSRP